MVSSVPAIAACRPRRARQMQDAIRVATCNPPTLAAEVAFCNSQKNEVCQQRMKLPVPKADFARSGCPVAVALDTLGDKWSLVLLRDMFAGKRRFSEFLASPEGIKRNILTERLQRLERAG